MLNFRLEWPPTVNTYWRYAYVKGRGTVVLLSAKGRSYKETGIIELVAQDAPHGDPDARYELLIDAYPPDRRRRDLDNILKPILDVLQDYGVLPDDEQVDSLTIRRRGRDPEKSGHVIIRLSAIDPEDSLAC